MRRVIAVLILTFAATGIDGIAERKTYQVIGKIVRNDGHSFEDVTGVVYLHGAVTPFTAKALTRADGQFKFKEIPVGTYMLVVSLQGIGRARKTVEVSPTLTDAKGNVSVTFEIDATKVTEKDQVISAAELSVPEAAKQEYSRAYDALARQDIDGAVARLKKAVQIAPQFASAWNQLGTISYQTRQYRRAEEYFREALRQDPAAFSPLVNLGGALLAQNKIQESLVVNLEAVKAMPGDALAHSQLGSSYFFLGRLDDAESELKQTKAIDPGHFSYPQLVLTEIYARKNNPAAAAAEIREFMKLHPDSEWIPKLRKALETLGEK